MEIICRPAQKEDCSTVAEMINIASSGLVEFMFHDLVPGMTPVQMITFSLAEDKNHYTYGNSIVAELNGKIVGMIFSYFSGFQQLSEEIRSFVPKERLDCVVEIYTKSVVDSLYIDALCVDKKYRCVGIGTELLNAARERAVEEGFKSLSLIVLADNKRAYKLYRKFGFVIVDKVNIESHDLIQHEGGAYLLKCDV